MADSVSKLARKLYNLERDVRVLGSTPQLAYSSIDDGALAVVQQDVTRMVIGEQHDGTTAPAVVSAGAPPTPTTPLVTEQLAALRVYWDGTFDADASAPMDFTRVTVHAVPLEEFVDYDPINPANIIGNIASATGGEVTAALPYGEHIVYLVAWNLAGRYSEASIPGFGNPRVGSLASLQMDPDEVAEAVVQTGILQSQFTVTGTLRILDTDAGWSAAEGLWLGDGVRLYGDGRPNKIEGDLVAFSLTVKDGLSVSGNADLMGTMDLSNGITAPTRKVSLSQTWPSSISTLGDGSTDQGGVYQGLLEFDATSWLVAVNFFATSLRKVRKTDGTWMGDIALGTWKNKFYPNGGIAAHGGSWYTVGSDGNRNGDYYIYRINATTGEKQDEFRFGDISVFSTRRVRLFSDGTNIGLVWYRPFSTDLRIRFYTPALVPVVGDIVLDAETAPVHVGDVHYGTGGTGATRLWVSLSQGDSHLVRAYNPASGYARAAADDFLRAQNSTIAGLSYDSTQGRMVSYDTTGIFWTYSKYVSGGDVSAQSTLYDGDTSVYPAGTIVNGVDVSGTPSTVHETGPSPVATFALSKRAWPVITADPAPDELVTDTEQVDKANRIGIYAAINGTPRLQAFLPVGTRTLPLTDELSTSGAVAGSGGLPTFDTASVPSPGRIKSSRTDTLGDPVIDLTGAGSGRVGPQRWDADGRPLNHGEWWVESNAANVPHATWETRVGWTQVNPVASTTSNISYAAGVFTVNQPGLYLLHATLTMEPLTTVDHRRIAAITLNGANIARAEAGVYQGVSGLAAAQQITVPAVWLNIGDQISFRSYQTSGEGIAFRPGREYANASITCLFAY